MSQITGAGSASGAIGAGVNEAIIGEIKKIKDPGTAQIVSAIVGAAAAKAVGGNAGSGATSAANGTKNNHAALIPLMIGGSFGQGFFMNSKRELVTDPEEIKKMAGFSDGWTLNILAEGEISTNLNGYQLICYGIGSTPGASLSAGWTFYEGSKDDF